MKEIARLILVLSIICIAAAASLSEVYTLTKGPIEKAAREEKLSAMRRITPAFTNEPDIDRVTIDLGKDDKGNAITRDYYIAIKDNAVVGIDFETSSSAGYGGTIYAIVCVTPDGIITGVDILKHSETPGLGTKVTVPGWLMQFKDRSLENTNWKVKKDGGDIDYASGATISPRAVTDAVKSGLEDFAKYHDEIMAGADTFITKP